MLAFCLTLISGCTKELGLPDGNFQTYVLKEGCHYPSPYCNEFGIDQAFSSKWIHGTSLTRSFKFDQSAKYETKLAENQADINKLFGFGDCKETDHHINSARVGWIWNKDRNALELHAYTYANTVLSKEYIADIEIGQVGTVEIAPLGNQYQFTYGSTVKLMPRGCSHTEYDGFELLPYFGGNETAPHTIRIDLD